MKLTTPPKSVAMVVIADVVDRQVMRVADTPSGMRTPARSTALGSAVERLEIDVAVIPGETSALMVLADVAGALEALQLTLCVPAARAALEAGNVLPPLAILQRRIGDEAALARDSVVDDGLASAYTRAVRRARDGDVAAASPSAATVPTTAIRSGAELLWDDAEQNERGGRPGEGRPVLWSVVTLPDNSPFHPLAPGPGSVHATEATSHPGTASEPRAAAATLRRNVRETSLTLVSDGEVASSESPQRLAEAKRTGVAATEGGDAESIPSPRLVRGATDAGRLAIPPITTANMGVSPPSQPLLSASPRAFEVVEENTLRGASTVGSLAGTLDVLVRSNEDDEDGVKRAFRKEVTVAEALGGATPSQGTQLQSPGSKETLNIGGAELRDRLACPTGNILDGDTAANADDISCNVVESGRELRLTSQPAERLAAVRREIHAYQSKTAALLRETEKARRWRESVKSRLREEIADLEKELEERVVALSQCDALQRRVAHLEAAASAMKAPSRTNPSSIMEGNRPLDAPAEGAEAVAKTVTAHPRNSRCDVLSPQRDDADAAAAAAARATLPAGRGVLPKAGCTASLRAGSCNAHSNFSETSSSLSDSSDHSIPPPPPTQPPPCNLNRLGRSSAPLITTKATPHRWRGRREALFHRSPLLTSESLRVAVFSSLPSSPAPTNALPLQWRSRLPADATFLSPSLQAEVWEALASDTEEGNAESLQDLVESGSGSRHSVDLPPSHAMERLSAGGTRRTTNAAALPRRHRERPSRQHGDTPSVTARTGCHITSPLVTLPMPLPGAAPSPAILSDEDMRTPRHHRRHGGEAFHAGAGQQDNDVAPSPTPAVLRSSRSALEGEGEQPEWRRLRQATSALHRHVHLDHAIPGGGGQRLFEQIHALRQELQKKDVEG